MVSAVDAAPAQAPAVPSPWRPWFHALAGAVYAVLVAVVAPLVVVPFVWWGGVAFVAAMVVTFVGACLIGCLIAGAFVRPPVSWLVGCVGVVSALVPSVVLVGYPVPTVVYAVVALAGASSALLAHPRIPRIAGLLLAAIVVAVVGVALAGEVSSASLAAAEKRFGTSVAPYVTEVAGFSQVAATATPMVGIALSYVSDDAEFLLSTEPVSTDDMVSAEDQVCMLPLELLSFDAELDALSCESTPAGWVRLSDTRRELAVVIDSVIVRAGAELSVDEAILLSAIAAIEPIEDAPYRKLLAGD